MRPTTYHLCTLLASAILATGAIGQPVERLTLDPHKPVEIAVGPKTATTLQFPRPVQGIFGYGLTDGNAEGTYHYAHPDGSRLITLRNLMPGKETFVTILLGEGDLYVLHLKPSATPPVAVQLRERASNEERQLARPVDPEEAKSRRLEPDTARLFNLLKLGKNERVFRAALPHLYRNAESRTAGYRHDDGEIATVVTSLHRFPDEDAVFLGGHIENKGQTGYQFDPGSVQVKVGSRTYPVALVDSAEEIPAGGKILIHVIIRGGVEGERAHLSIKNEFRLLMPAYAEDIESPALTDALGLVIGPPGSGPRIDPALFGDSANPETTVVNTKEKGSK